MLRGYVIPAFIVAGMTWMTMPPDPNATVPQESAERPADQTFLTYPEWYLVHSPEEYATFLAHTTAEEFPFMGHVGQFWSSYSAIYDHIADKYAFNAGYHMMVMVIGLSTTVEYAARSAYEVAFGRVSKWIAGDDGTMSAEDTFAAGAARRYVDFVNHTPFYKYPFVEDLKGLWEVPATGEGHPVRKWERRYVLTTEYGFKTFYAWFIGKMTAGAYTKPLLTTIVEIDGRLPKLAETPRLEVLEEKADTTRMNLPRYGEFTTYSLALARAGVQFRSVAGNTGDILTTVLVDADAQVASSDWMTVLFDQPLLTQPELKRLGLVCKVADLSRLLLAFSKEDGSRVEHVYDY